MPFEIPDNYNGGPDIERVLDFAFRLTNTRRHAVCDESAQCIDKRYLLAGLYGWVSTTSGSARLGPRRAEKISR